MLFFTVLGLSLAILHILFTKQKRTAKKVLEIFLEYLLFFNIGLAGLFAFYGHAFQADLVAKSIGWPAGSPFQYEVAIANLAFGVLGIISIWLRGNFWVATGIGYAVFCLGAAIGYFRDITLHHNLAENNAGIVLWLGDIAVPILILTLLVIYNLSKNKK